MVKKGFWFAFGAYFLWGLFPIYWKWLHHVDAVQLISHRIVWSFIILIIFIGLSQQLRDFGQKAFRKNVLLIYSAAAILIGINWLVYVWAVNANFIVETSLGYFINPLLSVLMGVIFLRERLRPFQWLPVGLAACGVVYLTFVYGRLPWIALTLAFSFGIYGLVKKISPLGSLFGLTIETGLLFIPALGFLFFSEYSGTGVFLHDSIIVNLLLFGAGVITTIPLLMFAMAAQSIPLSMVGIMQYIAPTLQFLLGIFLYKESFDTSHLIGFAFVWIGLLIFLAEGFWEKRKIPAQPIIEIGEGL
jgi:chloramphenicol-sensitive protein RarD